MFWVFLACPFTPVIAHMKADDAPVYKSIFFRIFMSAFYHFGECSDHFLGNRVFAVGCVLLAFKIMEFMVNFGVPFAGVGIFEWAFLRLPGCFDEFGSHTSWLL
jgi:hypothetical protein